MFYLGFVAATLTTISFIPQVYKVWKTNDTQSISFSMFLLFWIGVLCWLVYGFLKQDIAITIANGVTLILAGYILVKKMREMRNQKE